MNLFSIRNYFSALTAQSIIKDFSLENNIALISFRGAGNGEHIKSQLHETLWDYYYYEDINKYLVSEMVNPIQMKSFIKQREIDIRKIIDELKVKNVFLVAPTFRDQNILKQICDLNNITINCYEEGLNFYSSCVFAKPQKYTSKIVSKLYPFLLGDKSYVFDNSDLRCSINGNIYSLIGIDNSVKYSLHFTDSFKVCEKTINSVDSVYFSRPLYEGRLLSLRAELAVIKLFIKNTNKKENMLVKFHPRDSLHKIQLIKKYFSEEKIRVVYGYENVPGEYLLSLMNDNVIVYGHAGSVLFYGAKLFNKKVFSLIDYDIIYSNNNYFSQLKEEMQQIAPEIEHLPPIR